MSCSLFCLVSSLLMTFKFLVFEGLLLGLLSLLFSLIGWTWQVKLEGMLGYHNPWVRQVVKFSFIVFVFTEVMVFVSFFWAFFESSLSPLPEVGWVWPPHYIQPINPMGLPLMNTMLLLFSSILLTRAHYGLFRGESVKYSLWGTLAMGAFFVVLQVVEYRSSSFNISSGVYGSVFYCLTGLHGLHVIVGGGFLLYFILGYEVGTYTVIQSVWMELSSLYWHFVDVVWFFVWVFVYIWGS